VESTKILKIDPAVMALFYVRVVLRLQTWDEIFNKNKAKFIDRNFTPGAEL